MEPNFEEDPDDFHSDSKMGLFTAYFFSALTTSNLRTLPSSSADFKVRLVLDFSFDFFFVGLQVMNLIFSTMNGKKICRTDEIHVTFS